MRLFSPKLLWVLLFSAATILSRWVFNQLISFLFMSLSNHTSLILLNQDTTRNFKDDVPTSAISRSLHHHTEILQNFHWFAFFRQRRIFPVAISRSAVQVRGKIRTQLCICASLRIVWYLREKLKLSPNYAQLISGRSRLHQLVLYFQLILNLVVSQ